jgi:hypothetical protein
MTNVDFGGNDSGLILAAEECPPEFFEQYHWFSSYDNSTIRKLCAHGPVLIRGGRGSGKSALLLEAYRRMIAENSAFSVYISLRYLPLLQSDGEEYIGHFCHLLSQHIRNEVISRGGGYDFPVTNEQLKLQVELVSLAQTLGKRIVLLFDDAAHIGREKPLEVFFDLFRTISSNLVSCKASIYPGVTKFGVRFDIFNDSTVVDISRSDVTALPDFFPSVVRARYPDLAEKSMFSDRFSPSKFANVLGRAVVGNMRGLILACNRFSGQEKIGIPEVNKVLLEMAQDYYWPLMDEVAPKLGVYEPLIDPAREVMESIVESVVKPMSDRAKLIVSDRVLIHRQLVSQFIKIFEILEYLGFLSRREASRAMKSGGRGPVFALNLCSLLDAVPGRRLTLEMLDEWLPGTSEIAEIHVSGQVFAFVSLPVLREEHGLAILDKEIDVLGKSPAYPYGLGAPVIARLRDAGLRTVGDIAKATDDELDRIDYIGDFRVKQIRDVFYQAIWM